MAALDAEKYLDALADSEAGGEDTPAAVAG
jgi:hypothetical protein